MENDQDNSNNQKLKEKFNRHIEREKNTDREKIIRKNNEKEKELIQINEKIKEKEKEILNNNNHINKARNDNNKASFTIRNINILNSINNIDNTLTDTNNKLRQTKKYAH